MKSIRFEQILKKIRSHKDALISLSCLLIGVLLIVSSGIFEPSVYGNLPEAKSTFNSDYALFPPGFLTYEYNGSRISIEELQQVTSTVSLSFIPAGYNKNVYCREVVDGEYVMIYSPEPLVHLVRETLFSKACIIVSINISLIGLNFLGHTPPFREDEIRIKMQNLSEVIEAETNVELNVYRIGTDNDFYGYAYNGQWPWGAWQITMVLYDGTWIWIQACLPIQWMDAIAENIEIVPKTIL